MDESETRISGERMTAIGAAVGNGGQKLYLRFQPDDPSKSEHVICLPFDQTAGMIVMLLQAFEAPYGPSGDTVFRRAFDPDAFEIAHDDKDIFITFELPGPAKMTLKFTPGFAGGLADQIKAVVSEDVPRPIVKH
ncbi:MAG: hypothetical protein JWO33_1009 [Caulobacteraceae bacterium]|nr:hypothetical protein [Caulobacteraceae bacterium]